MYRRFRSAAVASCAAFWLASCGGPRVRVDDIDFAELVRSDDVTRDVFADATSSPPPTAPEGGGGGLPSTGEEASADAPTVTPAPAPIADRDTTPAPAAYVSASEGSEASETSPTAEVATATAPHAEDVLASVSLPRLVDELDQRLVHRREGLELIESGSMAKPAAASELERAIRTLSATSAPHERLALARRLVDALQEGESGSVESKLLAAALYGEAGIEEERDFLLAAAWHEAGAHEWPAAAAVSVGTRTSDTTDELASSARSIPQGPGLLPDDSDLPAVDDLAGREGPEFRLDAVRFVHVPDGESSYVRHPDGIFEPGERAMIFGEFVDFAEHEYTAWTREGSPPREVAVTKHLRLLPTRVRVMSPSGEIVMNDVVVDGPLEADESSARLSFWVELPMSESLADGEYTVEIDAVDRLAARRATSRLTFRVLDPDGIAAP